MSPFPDVATINEMIRTMRDTIREETKSNPDFKEEGEFMSAVLFNLEEELKGVKDINALEIKKKVRVLAFLSLLENAIEEMMDFDEDFDDFDDFDDEEDEDLLLDFEVEEEEEEVKPKKKVEKLKK